MYNLELANPMARQRACLLDSLFFRGSGPRWVLDQNPTSSFHVLDISLRAVNADKFSDYIDGPRTLQIRLSNWLPALLAG
jgi:hypothetical protein